jgi:hypothetical protein
MIDLELAHFISKFYLFLFFICFVLSFINKNNNKSNLIIISFFLIHCLIGQTSKMSFGFYTYYLVSAFSCLMVIIFSLLLHLYLRVEHKFLTVINYIFLILISMSYLIIHRVRVVIFDTDEPILWLINTHSALNLVLYFISICFFLYGSNIKWKSQFGRLSSLF